MASRRVAMAGALAATILMAGCSSGEQTVEGPVTVYVSLPLTGPRAAEGNDAADGARLALEQAAGRAGDLAVEAEFVDDSTGDAPWDPVLVGENARAAAQDSSTAAYIGELDSEPTRTSAPITNDAGIVQISPGAGGVDLTRAAAGYPDAPDRYRPSGEATFARVVPADDVVARAAVAVAIEDGLTARVVSDGTLNGDLVADEMKRAAGAAGLGLPPGGRVDAILYSGGPGSGAAEAARAAADGGASRVIATDALGSGVLEPLGGASVVTVGATLDPGNLFDPEFADEFSAEFGREPGPYAAYGYEAMQLALVGIEAAQGEGEFRPAIRDFVLGADRKGSVLGSFSVDDEGDTSLCEAQPRLGISPSAKPEAPVCG